MIGDALCRVLRFLGHKATSDNHIGDWGTQFGMILYGYKHFLDKDAYQKNPVEELARQYRLVRRLMDYQTPKEQPSAGEEGRRVGTAFRRVSRNRRGIPVLAETAKLHAGDAENRRLWQEFLPFLRG